MAENSLFVHPKQGIFIKICSCKIVELKTEGYALRNNDTGKVIVVTAELFNKRFKEIEDMTITKLKE